jgi:hypothetical protein
MLIFYRFFIDIESLTNFDFADARLMDQGIQFDEILGKIKINKN